MKLLRAWQVHVGDTLQFTRPTHRPFTVRQATYHTAETSDQDDQVVMFFEGYDLPIAFRSYDQVRVINRGD